MNTKVINEQEGTLNKMFCLKIVDLHYIELHHMDHCIVLRERLANILVQNLAQVFVRKIATFKNVRYCSFQVGHPNCFRSGASDLQLHNQ